MASRMGSTMRTPKRADWVGGTLGSFSSSPTIMQTGSLYSHPAARSAFRESSRPVYWISSSARLSQKDKAAQIDTPSSSLHTRTRRKRLSVTIGHSKPWLVVMSGTETMNSTPRAAT